MTVSLARRIRWEASLRRSIDAANAASFSRPPNGSDVKLRGQGPRGYGSAARRLPAFESRDAGGVTPLRYR
jgi:hypothetical protein